MTKKTKFYTDFLLKEENKQLEGYWVLETFDNLYYNPREAETMKSFAKWFERIESRFKLTRYTLKDFLMDFETYWENKDEKILKKKNWKSTFTNFLEMKNNGFGVKKTKTPAEKLIDEQDEKLKTILETRQKIAKSQGKEITMHEVQQTIQLNK